MRLLLECLRAQDTARIPKSLYTSHPRGASIVLRPTQSAQAEATFVAGEIKRLIAHTGGLLGYDDFAILLRFNALSRAVEGELQREGIASRMIVSFLGEMKSSEELAVLMVTPIAELHRAAINSLSAWRCAASSTHDPTHPYTDICLRIERSGKRPTRLSFLSRQPRFHTRFSTRDQRSQTWVRRQVGSRRGLHSGEYEPQADGTGRDASHRQEEGRWYQTCGPESARRFREACSGIAQNGERGMRVRLEAVGCVDLCADRPPLRAARPDLCQRSSSD